MKDRKIDEKYTMMLSVFALVGAIMMIVGKQVCYGMKHFFPSFTAMKSMLSL